MIVNSIFLVLCTIFMSLRMYTRIWIVRTFGWDDASLLLGFIFAVGLAANVMLANNVYYWYAELCVDSIRSGFADLSSQGSPYLGYSSNCSRKLGKGCNVSKSSVYSFSHIHSIRSSALLLPFG